MLSFTQCCTVVRSVLTINFLPNFVTRIFIATSLALGLSACATLPDNCYSSDPHAGLVVFGDSYSDTGHLMVNLPSPYSGARISNGPLAVEYLASARGTTAEPSFHPVGCCAGFNYAVVGGNIRGSGDGDLLGQVNEYLDRTDGSADTTALYFVMMGGNDVRQLNVSLNNAERDVELNSILDVLFAQLQRLADAGVKKLMVANGGDMGRLPGSIAEDPIIPHPLTTFSEKYNELFDTRMGSFVTTNLAAHPGLKIVTFDLFGEMKTILDDLTVNQFVNGTQACLDTDIEVALGVDLLSVYNTSSTPVCSLTNIDKFVFFDSVHATRRVHQLIADEIIIVAAQAFP